MDRDTVIALAREAGWQYADGDDGYNPLWRFAALIEAHLKEKGYRQCAKGQRTTQFCGMVEQAVKDEREECAQIAEEWQGPTKDRELHIAAAIRSRTLLEVTPAQMAHADAVGSDAVVCPNCHQRLGGR